MTAIVQSDREGEHEVDSEPSLAAFLHRVETRRVEAQIGLSDDTRSDHGQFFTPMSASKFIASLPSLPEGATVRILDPGAGVGSLTAALVARLVQERPGVVIEVVAVEVDDAIAKHLRRTMDECVDAGESFGCTVKTTALTADLVSLTTGFQRHTDPLGEFDLVIMNPPYRKLRKSERSALAAEGADAPNIYATFLAVGASVLRRGGQLVAITPRSFANGTYFKPFRRSFLSAMALDKLHLFESRSSVFADGGVLQENVIFSATKGGVRNHVCLTQSHGLDAPVTTRLVPYDEVVRPDDPNLFIRIPTSDDDTSTAGIFESLSCTLADLGIRASTGPVVDFRSREHLLPMPTDASVPLIYPANMRQGRVQWPQASCGKDQALLSGPGTDRLRLPGERYVLVKRFSSKEEKRRVVAVVYEPDDMPAGDVGIENHVNYFHAHGHGLERDFAYGLCLWLNSSLLDQHFRTFSGHTQVNVGDLKSMRYPSAEQLVALGVALGDAPLPEQSKIDEFINEQVLGS